MDVADEQATFGERLSDRVARVGGSWGFIIVFSLVLFGWMMLNSEILAAGTTAFDPFPYIFLNLMLSTIAAMQAPIIMMSQNRAGGEGPAGGQPGLSDQPARRAGDHAVARQDRCVAGAAAGRAD